MASVDTDGGHLSDDLMGRLQAEPQRYNLFQAIRLIERASPGCTALGHGDGRGEAVRLGAITSMKFEPRDIASVEPAMAQATSIATSLATSLRAPVVLRTPVMALAGAQGPLPEPFARRLFERAAQRDYATRDFLDIFHHRLLTFLYRSKKRRFASLSVSGDADGPPLASVLHALMRDGGIDDSRKRARRDEATGCRGTAPSGLNGGSSAPSWLSHAGLLSGAPRSLQGLETLLRHRLGIRADATPFAGGWLAIDAQQQCRIACARTGGTPLDGRWVLGRRAWDQSAGIAVRCTVTGQAQMDALLPGGERHAVLIDVLKRYLSSRLTVHVTVRMEGEPPRGARLSTSAARLGWTARLSLASSLCPGGSAPQAHARFTVRLDAEPEAALQADRDVDLDANATMRAAATGTVREREHV